ncbi:MAG: hypothetical protein M4D80_40945 [Myxococcota bacterium]|nr:hypothetical protein [Myxococcota bacterium]
MELRLIVLLLAACSSNKPRTGDDATHPPPPLRDAAFAIDAPVVVPSSAGKTGDLQVRVEWRDVPIPMRASPGRTACKTPRLPTVAPTTTWGVPEVLVVVEGATIPSASSRIVLADCALAPRIVASTSVVVESATDRPTQLSLAKRGDLASIDKLEKGTPRPVQLPIAGHAVALPLDASGIYELAADTETAWIVAAPNAGVTESNGALLVRDLTPGSYAVTAWLPPRAGAPAKLAKGTATVVAGDLADLTLTLK